MYLVMGITGHVGGATARHLLAAGKQVKAMVRDMAKAKSWADQGVELIQGEWEDVDALSKALENVEGAYLMMPPTQTPSHGFPEAKKLTSGYANALKQAEPPRVVCLSSMGAEQPSGLGLITSTAIMERSLETLPVPVAFVRAGGFYENFLYGLQTGQGGVLPTFYAPADRKLAMIATDDIGAEVAKLLLGPAWHGAKYVEIASQVSPDEVAAQLGEVLGREVKAQVVPREGWAGALEHMGMPKGSTWAFEEMVEGVNSGWIHLGNEGTEKVEGTTSAKAVFAKAKGAAA